jgi:CheY-like chemotaxis protein
LGLSTVYGIVKQFGGAISVESEEGRGSTFKLYLPAHPLQPIVPPTREADKQSRGNGTILLVEDEAGVRGFVRHVLDGQGFTVLEAANGVEALRVAAEHKGSITLLLTDAIMPQMSGAELAEKLKASRPALPVLCMSGYPEDGWPRVGASPIIQKPFTPSALLSRVREALSGAGS